MKFKHVFMFLLIFTASFAQYTKNDKELIRTTFLREFDTEIIDTYLNSDNPENVIAALLSIANSGDTNFAGQITDLNFTGFGEYICFALGELGPDINSAEFLLNKIKEPDNPFLKESYEALGKTGKEDDLNSVIKYYFENPVNGYGIPYALYNFYIRGIKSENGEDVKLLKDELKSHLDDDERRFDALFALYRYGTDITNENILLRILSGNYDIQSKVYTLGIFRKQNYFPENFSLFKKLINSEDWPIRCEAARTLCYYNFMNKEEVDLFFELVKDKNPNTARTAASSVRNISIDDKPLYGYLISKTESLINEKSLTENTQGELLISLQSLNPEYTLTYLTEYDRYVKPEYIYQMFAAYDDPYYSFDFLKKSLKGTDARETFLIHQSIAALGDSLLGEKEYRNFVLKNLQSENPLIPILYNIVIDSSFTANTEIKLEKIFTEVFNRHINDPEFSQTLALMYQTAKNIDTTFQNELLNKVRSSVNNSLKYQLRNEPNADFNLREYREELFNKIFEYSFSGKNVKVITEKGSFTLELYPRFAPVTVGNFLRLTNAGFYNDIIFHRVVPDFVIQSGDPTGTGWSGPEYEIVSEFSPLPFDTYYLGMASSGKDTEGSQWFVMQNYYPHLDGNYTNFGKVIEGKEIIKMIDQNDVIKIMK